MFKILDVVRPDYTDQNALEKFNKFKLQLNGIYKDVQPLNHLSFTLLIKDQDIVAFCGIYNNGRYPPGVYRIFNRFYMNKNFRTKSLVGFWYACQILGQYQIDQFGPYMDVMFFSMEGHKVHAAQKVIDNLQNPNWSIEPNFVKVAPCGRKTCYQTVGYKLVKSYKELPLKKINKEEYNELPD